MPRKETTPLCYGVVYSCGAGGWNPVLLWGIKSHTGGADAGVHVLPTMRFTVIVATIQHSGSWQHLLLPYVSLRMCWCSTILKNLYERLLNTIKSLSFITEIILNNILFSQDYSLFQRHCITNFHSETKIKVLHLYHCRNTKQYFLEILFKLLILFQCFFLLDFLKKCSRNYQTINQSQVTVLLWSQHVLHPRWGFHYVNSYSVWLIHTVWHT